METYRTILVHIDDGPQSAERIRVAMTLALRFGATLAGMYVVPTPGITPTVGELLPDAVLRRRLREAGDAQHAAEALFRDATAASGIAEIEWSAPAGPALAAAVAHAHAADLTIVGQPHRADDDRDFVDDLASAAMLSSGRPVLVIPHGGTTALFEAHALLAWDGSREAVRAMADAMPFLARCARVGVVTVNEAAATRPPGVEHDHARMTAWLRRHGVREVTWHSDTADDVSVGEWLLARATELGVDGVVMGAYARARWQELVLGGTTRTVLEDMKVAVLMSH